MILVSSLSYPAFVPSQSMLVNRISPAPRRFASIAHSTASKPTSILPPFLYTFHPLPSALRLASIATTTHWLPNLSAASLIRSGVLIAEELMEILSAPSRKIALKSSTVRIPPPTVNGINTFSATFLTISIMIFLASDDAVISKNTSSSAPALSYAAAISTGSPASIRLTKLTPFTTRPAFTSKHGIILFVCIANSSYSETKFFKICNPTVLLFSGWNWQAKMLSFSTAA